MKIRIFILLILIINIYGCEKNVTKDDTIGIFDISKDDKTILFSYKKNNVSSIYSMNIDGSNIKSIIEANNGKTFANPRYSSDNKKIVYIESNTSDKKSSKICIAEADGSNKTTLINSSSIITEAFFSANKNEIIFCKANEYKNYSPIGRKAPHSFDIYSINVENKQSRKLTNFNAYLINHVMEIEKEIAFHINSELYNGIYTLSNNTLNIISTIPKDDPSIMYSDFLFIPEKKEIIYVKSYDLYSMDINKKEAKFLLTSNFGIISLMRKFNNSNKILCSIQNDTDLYILENNKFSANVIPVDFK